MIKNSFYCLLFTGFVIKLSAQDRQPKTRVLITIDGEIDDGCSMVRSCFMPMSSALKALLPLVPNTISRGTSGPVTNGWNLSLLLNRSVASRI